MVSIKMAAGTGSPAHLSTPDRLAGLASFTIAATILRILPFRAVLVMARLFKRLALQAASRQDAERAVAARDWAARWFPGRAACLENSLAAFIFAALHGRSTDWCIGCRLLPAESHAWIQADGSPVGEPAPHGRQFHVTVQV
jgi:hypothetical protein